MTAGLDWTTASTLADLGELTARYLLGEFPRTPTHYGPPCEETTSIRDRLVQLNRAGLVSENSQPGEIDQYGRQRAWVEGFCDATTREAIEDAGIRAGLIVLVRRPHAQRMRCFGFQDWYPNLPMTVDLDWRVYSDAGGWTPASWLRKFYPRSAVRVRLASWNVQVLDPEWGRTDPLWDTLTRALEGGPTPI